MQSLNDFFVLLKDKAFYDFQKMQYKYGSEVFRDFFGALKSNMYTQLPLKDFTNENILLLESKIKLTSQLKKALLKQYADRTYSAPAMEHEIMATLSIEAIDTSRESVRKILAGFAPTDKNEEKAYGIKRGLDFIADTCNPITAANLHKLYLLAIDDFLPADDRLQPGEYYRHGPVYIVGTDIRHEGLPANNLTEYVNQLLDFIKTDDDLDQIIKSTIIHYYFAYLHPYFDGNGRMSRLLQMWYLIQCGFTEVLFIPFSKYINESRNQYYKTFDTISTNKHIAGLLDVTPFVIYFIDHVFSKMDTNFAASDLFATLNSLIENGQVTLKEKALFKFVVSTYASEEFSTKQLEKDFGNAAYATIRTFVLKFEAFGLLGSRRYGARVRYRLTSSEKDSRKN